MTAVAAAWRATGISWSGLGPLCGVLFGASIAAAYGVFRLGKSVLRVTPETPQLHLAGALKETLTHLPADKALAVVCSGQTCLPPTNDPQHLSSLLTDCSRSEGGKVLGVVGRRKA